MDLTTIILVNSQRLLARGVEYATIPWCKVLDVLDIRLQEAFVLCVDLKVVTDQAWERLGDGGQSARVVE